MKPLFANCEKCPIKKMCDSCNKVLTECPLEHAFFQVINPKAQKLLMDRLSQVIKQLEKEGKITKRSDVEND